jgi:flagellar basal-body rod protein FlgG
MERSLYVIASAMVAELSRGERIANDLANAATPGYKSETATQRSFDDMLLFSRMNGEEVGDAGLGVVPTAPRLDLTQGPLRQTGEQLDVALDGDGWFALRTDGGTRYTRNGQFRLAADGTLVTADGRAVLGKDEQPIVVKNPREVEILPDGTVQSAGKAAGTLAVALIGNPQKAADGLYSGTPAGMSTATFVRQGYLEGSGVDVAATMVDMIVSLRAFEAGQRVLKAADETLSRAIAAGGATSS